MRNKCVDPCPGTCGQNAECSVINHVPICTCFQNYTGNAFVLCMPRPGKLHEHLIDAGYNLVFPAPPKPDPCDPSPCGPNSQCKVFQDQAVCSCVPEFRGSPPSCRPECTSSSECLLSKACVNQKCIDPCPGSCGINAICNVVNHNPICSCLPTYTGDPFTRCTLPPGSLFNI